MASSGSTGFGRRGSEMSARRLERLARASSRGIAVAQQALSAAQQAQGAVDALVDASGNLIGGTGALGPITVVGRGDAYGTIPVGGFKQGAVVSGVFTGDTDGADATYICFGSVFVQGRPIPSLMVMLLSGGLPEGGEFPPEAEPEVGRVIVPLLEFFGESGPEVHHAVATPGGSFIVPTPADAFGLGETLAFPYLEIGGTLRVAQTEAGLPFALPAGTYAGRGVPGVDGAVYFMPRGGLPVLRLDPETGALTFVQLPGDAGEASFVNGALHGPSGHILAAPEAGSGGRVLGISTLPGASPPSTFWVQGFTRVYSEFALFSNDALQWSEIVDGEGVLRVVDQGIGESDEGVSSGIAWNPDTQLFVLAPGSGAGDLMVLRYVPGGASQVRRYPLRTEPRGVYLNGMYTNAIYNPARGSVVLLPADALRLLEVRYTWFEADFETLAPPPEEAVLYNFAFPFGPKIFGAVVHAGRLLCFPFLAPSPRVLDLDAARDPSADNLVSFYGY